MQTQTQTQTQTQVRDQNKRTRAKHTYLLICLGMTSGIAFEVFHAHQLTTHPTRPVQTGLLLLPATITQTIISFRW